MKPEAIRLTALENLSLRGLRAECTPQADYHLEADKRSIYCGFESSSTSLHLEDLVPLTALRHLQLLGHRPVLVLSGAAVQIGDASGRNVERIRISEEEVRHNADCIKAQISTFLDFDSGPMSAVVVNNLDWQKSISIIEFIQQTGKLLPAGRITGRAYKIKNSERETDNITIADLLYVSLQALDFCHLFALYGCTVRAGGRDQWGSITTGIELVKRKYATNCHGISLAPFFQNSANEGTAKPSRVWLCPTLLTPFAMHQFFLQASDIEAVKWLKLLTFFSMDKISEIACRHRSTPGNREAQKLLANAVTQRVHGEQCLKDIHRQTELLFQRDASSLSDDELTWLAGLSDHTFVVDASDVLTLLTCIHLADSKSEARRLLEQQGITINGEKVDAHSDLNQIFSDKKYVIVKRGKQQARVVTRRRV